MNETLRAWIDLLRLRFFFAWPLLFCSGYLLATVTYGGFSWSGLGKVALIGFLGFEAGLVLNDYIDREFDRKDIDHSRLTRYWRSYGTRPIPAGLISPLMAGSLVIALVLLTTGLAMTLPYPNSVFVLLIMFFCYTIEIFYQEEKRQQDHPSAQLIGRLDFALFPVAGYLCAGRPDVTAALYFLFFYPFALAHLGVNDLVDIANDRVRGMKTIPILFSPEGTTYWIAGFSVLNIIAAGLFMAHLDWIARAGIAAGLCLGIYASAVLLNHRRDENLPDIALRVLPCFHVAMILSATGIALGALHALL